MFIRETIQYHRLNIEILEEYFLKMFKTPLPENKDEAKKIFLDTIKNNVNIFKEYDKYSSKTYSVDENDELLIFDDFKQYSESQTKYQSYFWILDSKNQKKISKQNRLFCFMLIEQSDPSNPDIVFEIRLPINH